MKILLVAATPAEVAPLLARCQAASTLPSFQANEHTINILLTGVGMLATAFNMGKHLATHSYDLAINAGIAGSFDFSIPLGEVVNISEDVLAELGAEDGDSFLSLSEMGFGDVSFAASDVQQAPVPDTMKKVMESLKTVKAITVNKVHGNELSIAKTLSRFKAQTESMEGAAFLYACNQFQLPCLQIRAISNYVERRNREKWNIALAVKNLNDLILALLELNNI